MDVIDFPCANKIQRKPIDTNTNFTFEFWTVWSSKSIPFVCEVFISCNYICDWDLFCWEIDHSNVPHSRRPGGHPRSFKRCIWTGILKTNSRVNFWFQALTLTLLIIFSTWPSKSPRKSSTVASSSSKTSIFIFWLYLSWTGKSKINLFGSFLDFIAHFGFRSLFTVFVLNVYFIHL